MAEKLGRRAAREKALTVLYALHFNPPLDLVDLEEKFYLSPFRNTEKVDDEHMLNERQPALEFALDLVKGVFHHQQELDQRISSLSQHWKLERIAIMDRLILRLALLEMMFRKETPLKVLINEAIELSKQYSDHNAPAFINGILDSASKELT